MSDTVDTAVIKLARDTATKHGLSPQLVCAVVEQESGWNTYAVRYEPVFMREYVAPQYTANKFSATEAYTRAMSWGLLQIMGEVAREFGFTGLSLAELTAPEKGLEFGCRKLKSCFDKAKGDEPKSLLFWNGGSSVNYPAEVLARKANYSA